jgi:hypothetical protein
MQKYVITAHGANEGYVEAISKDRVIFTKSQAEAKKFNTEDLVQSAIDRCQRLIGLSSTVFIYDTVQVMSVSRKPKAYYDERAVQWAERYGILEYKVQGNKMFYVQTYGTRYEKPYTVKSTINLDTMTTESRVKLSRINRKGYYNV